MSKLLLANVLKEDIVMKAIYPPPSDSPKSPLIPLDHARIINFLNDIEKFKLDVYIFEEDLTKLIQLFKENKQNEIMKLIKSSYDSRQSGDTVLDVNLDSLFTSAPNFNYNPLSTISKKEINITQPIAEGRGIFSGIPDRAIVKSPRSENQKKLTYQDRMIFSSPREKNSNELFSRESDEFINLIIKHISPEVPLREFVFENEKNVWQKALENNGVQHRVADMTIVLTEKGEGIATKQRFAGSLSTWLSSFQTLHKKYSKENDKESQNDLLAIIFNILTYLIDSLAHLQKQKIAHQDIKPDNLFIDMVSNKFKVSLGDFGSGLDLDAKDKYSTATKEGIRKGYFRCGTLVYLPPERLDVFSRIDTKKPGDKIILSDEDLYKYDVYAVGIILSELLPGINMRWDLRLNPEEPKLVSPEDVKKAAKIEFEVTRLALSCKKTWGKIKRFAEHNESDVSVKQKLSLLGDFIKVLTTPRREDRPTAIEILNEINKLTTYFEANDWQSRMILDDLIDVKKEQDIMKKTDKRKSSTPSCVKTATDFSNDKTEDDLTTKTSKSNDDYRQLLHSYHLKLDTDDEKSYKPQDEALPGSPGKKPSNN